MIDLYKIRMSELVFGNSNFFRKYEIGLKKHMVSSIILFFKNIENFVKII